MHSVKRERRRILNETAASPRGNVEPTERKERRDGKEELKEMSEEEREREESDKQLRKEERGDTRQEERDSCHRWKKRIRGCKESPLPMRRGWNRGGRREGASKREETPPKALLYLSYNYHNRASNHPSPPPYSPPRPPSTDHLPPPFLQPLPNSRNRKLETREYIFSSFFSA